MQFEKVGISHRDYDNSIPTLTEILAQLYNDKHDEINKMSEIYEIIETNGGETGQICGQIKGQIIMKVSLTATVIGSGG